MRTTLTFLSIFFLTSVNAQTLLPGTIQKLMMDHTVSFYDRGGYDSGSVHKWFVTPYAGITTGYGFFRNSGSFFLTVPIGVQLNRRVSNNVYAFSRITVAPVIMNFNQPLHYSYFSKFGSSSNMLHPGLMGSYSSASLGLMYVNDARTFSVSGSIGVERSNYPVYFISPVNNTSPTRNVSR